MRSDGSPKGLRYIRHASYGSPKGLRYIRHASHGSPNRLRQGYGGPPKRSAKVEGLRYIPPAVAQAFRPARSSGVAGAAVKT
jgi:hypothetical protein